MSTHQKMIRTGIPRPSVTLAARRLVHATSSVCGDSVLLGYCAGDSKVGALNRLRIRRVSLASLWKK